MSSQIVRYTLNVDVSIRIQEVPDERAETRSCQSKGIRAASL